MPLTKEKTKTLIDEFKVNVSDSGSAPVQISLITERIAVLSEHFKKAPKDYGSRQGLLKLVSRRKRLLNYLKRQDADGYSKLIARLDLRK